MISFLYFLLMFARRKKWSNQIFPEKSNSFPGVFRKFVLLLVEKKTSIKRSNWSLINLIRIWLVFDHDFRHVSQYILIKERKAWEKLLKSFFVYKSFEVLFDENFTTLSKIEMLCWCSIGSHNDWFCVCLCFWQCHYLNNKRESFDIACRLDKASLISLQNNV